MKENVVWHSESEALPFGHLRYISMFFILNKRLDVHGCLHIIATHHITWVFDVTLNVAF